MPTVTFNPEETRIGSRRGGAARAALFAHVVEGRTYTTAQIAQRLGITTEAARIRVKRRSHPLTWESLSRDMRKAA